MKKILKIQKNKIYFENDDEIIDISPEIKRQFALKAGDDITLKYNEKGGEPGRFFRGKVWRLVWQV